MGILRKTKNFVKTSNTVERFKARNGLGLKLSRKIKKPFKIGMAITAYERPEYLEICLNSLFETNLHDYDITFLLQDDGSTDPRVAEIINKERDSKYKIVRYFTPKGPNNAGAAINKALRKLLEMDDFDIIGWGDADALFHPEWLDNTMKVSIWAKEHHKDHILGPFTSFNSSDFAFHRILGRYDSPYGSYVVKRQAGMLNYFYFKDDFKKLGFFAENKDDETLMTIKFENLKVRNFCTETSWVEHLGQVSVLNKWRPTPVMNAVHAIHPAPGKWGSFDINDYRKHPKEYYAEIERLYSIDIFNIDNNSHVNSLGRVSRTFKNMGQRALNAWQSIQHYKNLITWWNNNLININRVYNVQVSRGLNEVIPSTMPLDIVIPAIDRDSDVLNSVIDSIHEFVNHPIQNIYIVSPESKDLRKLAVDKNCEFVLETDVLPLKLKDINYKVEGKDRSGWLYQQLLKWEAAKIVSTDNYLVLDADTVFIRPHVFETNGKFILELADESHTPYYTTYSKLTGEAAYSPFSFVAHHMLINKDHLRELKALIEKETDMKWHEAIIKLADREHPAGSGFSEYETYGNYMFQNHRDSLILEYWYNLSLKRSDLHNLGGLRNKYNKKYKTLSFQYYKV